MAGTAAWGPSPVGVRAFGGVCGKEGTSMGQVEDGGDGGKADLSIGVNTLRDAQAAGTDADAVARGTMPCPFWMAPPLEARPRMPLRLETTRPNSVTRERKRSMKLCSTRFAWLS